MTDINKTDKPSAAIVTAEHISEKNIPADQDTPVFPNAAFDPILEELIKSAIESLNKAMLWIMLSLTVLAISVLGTKLPGENKKELKLFSVHVPREGSNIFIFLFLIAINYYIYNLYRNIRNNYENLADKKKARIMLQRNASAANPFSYSYVRKKSSSGNPGSKKAGTKKLIFDAVGYAILFLVWWSALYLGITMALSTGSLATKLFCLVCAGVYCVIGLVTRNAINAMLRKIGAETVWKTWMLFVAATLALAFICWQNWIPITKFFKKEEPAKTEMRLPISYFLQQLPGHAATSIQSCYPTLAQQAL